MFELVVFDYIGPGLGAGALVALFGAIGAVFLALFSILYYPIKRMRKKRKAQKAAKINNKITTPIEMDE